MNNDCKTQEELDETESYYITWYKQLGLAYNINLEAKGIGKVSEETKQKISRSLAGHVCLKETIDKIKATMQEKGKFWHSEETKKKMSDTRKGKKRKPLTDDHKEKMRQARLGKKLPKHTEEANLRLGASRAKEFSFTKPDGEQVHFINLQKFCRDNNLQAGNMYRVFVGERKSHKGWTK